MKGLIVAGIAGLAGIAGVAGLSGAATGGGGDGAAATTGPILTSTAPGSLSERLTRVRAAERAADAALAVTAPAATTGGDDGTLAQGPGDRGQVTGAQVDDDGEDHADDDHGRGRGRHGHDDD